MIPDGYLPPLRNTEDIPIHRPNVGGMGLSAPAEPAFKPYVYRGWDIDLFEDLPPVTRPAPPKPKPRRRAQRPPQPVSRPASPEVDQDLAVALAAAREAAEMLALAEREDRPKKKKKKGKRKKAKKRKPKPEPKRFRKPPTPVRPSPGWKPTTGADLDEMLALLEDE